MTATTSLKLPDDLRARVSAEALRAGKSAHAFMIDAIERETALREKRLAFVEAALEAEREMERTGLGYDARDVHAYLRAKIAGKKPKEPKLKPWRA